MNESLASCLLKQKCVGLKGCKLSQGFSNLFEMANHLFLEYCPGVVYKLLLFSIHMLIYTYKRLEAFLSALWNCYVALGLTAWRKDLTFHEQSFGCLKRDSNELIKLPKHLGIICPKDDHMYLNLLTNIVSWAITFGVSYVSLYDHDGKLKCSQDVIEARVLKKLKKLLGENYGNYSLTLKDSAKPYDNGYVHTKGICIQVLCAEDGKQDVIKVAKELTEEVLNNQQDPSTINDSIINSTLRGTKGLPDPDLVLQFGNILTLDGFLPWQSRLTEIISLRIDKSSLYAQFLKALKRYSRCQQRFGQ